MPKMDKEQFKNFLSDEIANSLNYIDSKLAKRRETILNYIQLQMPDFPRRPGGSGVVDGTVGSQIGLLMPGLMRIMCGGPNIGEYNATGRGDDEAAQLATEYVNTVVLRQDNEGERLFHDWAYDGLTQILGVVKGYWEEEIEEDEQTLEGLTADELAMIAMRVEQDPTLSITAGEEKQAQEIVQDPATGMQVSVSVSTFDVTIKKTINRSRVKLCNIPPEEFVVSTSARTLDESILKSHRTYKRAGELKDMGYPAAVIDTLPTYNPFRESQEQLNRSGQVWDWGAQNTADDPDMRMIAVHQGIIKCNYDGKGIKDHYFVCAGNEEVLEVLECVPYDDQVQFYDFCPQPIPHTVFGRCPGDDLVQLQQIKTAILRPTIDNLNQANTPQRIVAAAALEKGGLEALVNRVPSGIVLAKAGMIEAAVKELATPFFSQHSFPMLAYFDDEAEKRTGVSRSAMGLDPDTLQRQTATQATIAQSAAMGKVEMIARIWATGGVRKMFRGILRILKKYQDFPRVAKIKGQLQQVDPAQWQNFDEWDVTINTGLGTGSKERDVAALMLLLGKQEAIIAQAGPGNPLVTPGQYSKTLRELVAALGLQKPDEYISSIPADFQLPTPAPPSPTPDALVYAEVEKYKANVKAEADTRLAIEKMNNDRMIAENKAALDHQYRMEELRLKGADIEVKAADISMKATHAARAQDMEQERMDIDLITKARANDKADA
jgi:hypothetical protein